MSNPQTQRGDDIVAAEERARVHVQAEKLSKLLMLLRDIRPFLPLPGRVERQETAEYLEHLHRRVDAALENK